jgi:hypothetical protein
MKSTIGYEKMAYLLARSGTKPGEKIFGSGGIVSQSKIDLTIDLIWFTDSICKNYYHFFRNSKNVYDED